MNKKKLCIYHGNCQDGYGAYMAVRMALGDDVRFFKGIHGNAPPTDIKDRDVIMVDFSYKRDVIIEIATYAKSVLILDHHESAEKDLVDLPDNVEVIFDMERSGAVIAWEYYHPNVDIPDLFKYIQDRDLWRFEYDWTKPISAGLFSYPYDYDMWLSFIDDKNSEIDSLMTSGIALMRNKTKEIEEYLVSGVRRVDIFGYNVPIVNLPYFYSSEVGNILAKGEPFAVCYYETEDGREYSLRSSGEEGSVNVAEIASWLGGGGHRNASGFRIPWSARDTFIG